MPGLNWAQLDASDRGSRRLISGYPGPAEVAARPSPASPSYTALPARQCEQGVLGSAEGFEAAVDVEVVPREELSEQLATATTGPTPERLAALADSTQQAVDQAEPHAIKRLFESLVREVQVTARDNTVPYF